jgi:hypothetical protein
MPLEEFIVTVSRLNTDRGSHCWSSDACHRIPRNPFRRLFAKEKEVLASAPAATDARSNYVAANGEVRFQNLSSEALRAINKI